MIRTNDTIIQKGQLGNWGQNTAVNLGHGGQLGWAPRIKAILNSQPYVRQNLICILLRVPTGFLSMRNPQLWISALRSLFEERMEQWQGFNSTINVDFAESAIDGGGNFFEVPSDAKITRTSPSSSVDEVYGKAISKLMKAWIEYLIMHPQSKYPMINTIEGVSITDMLADRYSATALFFEPSPDFRTVQDAWLVTNMMPKSSGEISGERSITNGSDKQTLNYEWTGITQSTSGVIVLAQQILNNINITGANPTHAAAMLDGISADVEAWGKEGYAQGARNVASEAINPNP